MSRLLTSMLTFTAILAATVAPADAQSQKIFTVSANVDEATSFNIDAFEVDPDTLQFTPVVGLNLAFGTLDLDPQNGIFLPDHFFAIDVGPSGGVGNPNVTAVYTEGNNPNQSVAGNGLGHKATITFVKVSGGGETGIGATPKIRLIDSNGTPGNGAISKSQLTGGFLRMYLGIVAFDPAATFPDPANAEPFTAADEHGIYDGTLVITATPA